MENLRGGMGILRDGLRTGACPKLESLGYFDIWSSNEERKAVVKLIEKCQNLPGCFPIRKLGGYWQTSGSDNVLEHLLRALLPFIEEFLFEGPTSNMVRMVKELGVPCLKLLHVCDSSEVSLIPLIEALNSSALPSLERLNLCADGLDTACVDQLLGLLRSHRHHLLPPHLTSVVVEPEAFALAEDGDRFFGSLGKEEGVFFPSSVKEFEYVPDNTSQYSIQSVASAITRGAFPGLENLVINSFIKEGFATLCQALLTPTCGNQLKKLGLDGCDIMNAEDVRILADVFEQGGLPFLQEISLTDEEDPEGQDMTCLLNALKTSHHASLRTLILYNVVRMGDAGMAALASAAQEGGCFMHLHKLDLSSNSDFSDMGLMALSNAIAAGCVPKLAKLDMSMQATRIDHGGGSAVALLCCLLTHCPDLNRYIFPDN